MNSFLVKEYGYAIVDPGVLLDRGFGYTLNREHSRSQCGMEIVFPNSGRFRTGPGDMKDNATFPLYKGVLPPIELWPPLLILTIPKRPVFSNRTLVRPIFKTRHQPKPLCHVINY